MVMRRDNAILSTTSVWSVKMLVSHTRFQRASTAPVERHMRSKRLLRNCVRSVPKILHW